MSEKSNSFDFTEYAFFNKLTELPFVDVIYVYGSRARGDADERSDIDLAILCPEATEEDWKQVEAIATNADILVSVDVVRWDKLPGNSVFRQSIVRERTPVFIRRVSSYKEIMAEVFAMMDWHIKSLKEIMATEFGSEDEKNRAAGRQYQRTFRYLWRTCRRVLALYGMRTHSPLSTFKHAYMEGWLVERRLWEKMYRDWLNLLPDDQPQVLAELSSNLPKYLAAIEQVVANLHVAIDTIDDHKKKS
jgi:uncharacterized protein